MTTTLQRTHNDPDVVWTHAWFVKGWGENPELCDVHECDWPYECIAKDLNPDAAVYCCDTHCCWWHA